jgi:hypothetical protein
MKGAYNINNAYSNACVLKVFIGVYTTKVLTRVAYNTTINAY